MHPEQVVYVVAGVLVGGVVAQWLGWRLRVPAIVFLLFGGLIAGPITGVLDPDETFGDLLFPAVSMAVAVILFEGALGLGLRGLRQAGTTVWMLLTLGAAVTMACTTAAARWVLDIDWQLAVLLAAVLVVTGPTVIGPIMRTIGLRGRVAAILEAEGTIIDPIGAILAVLVFQVFYGPGESGAEVVRSVLATFGVGLAIGLAAAGLLIVALARYLIPDELHNIATLAAVLGTFAVANGLWAESGLVAVTAMGFALASQDRVPVRHVLEFNETLRILFISGLFVLLGARISPETLASVEWRNIVFLAVLVAVVRPLSAYLSTLGSDLTRAERVFIGATAPRGIVAAAIASVYSLQLAEDGVANSQVLVSATFTVIAGTVLLSGLGSRRLARRLGLIDDDAAPMVLLGSNPVSRELASALEKQGAPVRLLDLDRRELTTARMHGLPTHRGSVLADRTWEEAGIDRATCFLALTPNDELNILASRKAAAVLGRRRVFQLPPSRPEHAAWWDLPAGTFARPLFDKGANYQVLAERIEAGWQVSATRLTDRFGPAQYEATHPDALPLFTVGSRDQLDLIATDAPRRFRVGDTVVALTPPEPTPKPVPATLEPVDSGAEMRSGQQTGGGLGARRRWRAAR